MKIFIVQSHLGGGGAERVGCLLAKGFMERGDEPFIVTDLNKPRDYYVDSSVGVLNMMPAANLKLIRWGGAILNLRKLVRKYQPDVIIGIMQLSSFISRVACIGTNTHVIMTEHDSFERPDSAPMSKAEYFCKFYLNKIYECVTVITQADKDYIGNRLRHVVVMPNPLLLPQVTKIPSKQRVVLSAGRLDAWHYKGFDVLIRAWNEVVKSEKLKAKSEGWKLLIAGTGSENSLNYLKQLCRENGVEDSVEFLGFRRDVEKLYQDASIFVLSSRYEGFGLVLIEAMSQGCACVACDYKGRQREILNPLGQSSKFNVQSSNNKVELCETGILCEPDNVESLAAGIQTMMTDDEYREFVKKNAIERSDYYNLDKTIGRWESLLLQLTNKETSC